MFVLECISEVESYATTIEKTARKYCKRNFSGKPRAVQLIIKVIRVLCVVL